MNEENLTPNDILKYLKCLRRSVSRKTFDLAVEDVHQHNMKKRLKKRGLISEEWKISTCPVFKEICSSLYKFQRLSIMMNWKANVRDRLRIIMLCFEKNEETFDETITWKDALELNEADIATEIIVSIQSSQPDWRPPRIVRKWLKGKEGLPNITIPSAGNFADDSSEMIEFPDGRQLFLSTNYGPTAYLLEVLKRNLQNPLLPSTSDSFVQEIQEKPVIHKQKEKEIKNRGWHLKEEKSQKFKRPKEKKNPVFLSFAEEQSDSRVDLSAQISSDDEAEEPSIWAGIGVTNPKPTDQFIPKMDLSISPIRAKPRSPTPMEEDEQPQEDDDPFGQLIIRAPIKTTTKKEEEKAISGWDDLF